MGRDKADLVWRGQSLAARASALLAGLCEPVVLIGAATTGLPDRRPGQGPLGGMETALDAATGRDALILACDLPAVDRALLLELLRRPRGFGRRGGEARVATGHGRLQPLCGVYSSSCGPLVGRALDRGERSVLDLLSSLRVVTVEAGDRLANVNTPEDWERWRAGSAPAAEAR